MKIHDLVQGSPEWLAYRAQHFNASDAPAMMGCSPYKTRAELLRELHTGVAAAVDIGTQKRFDNGHRAEALARPLGEEFVGAELYPVTGSAGRLSASFDGLTMDESTVFEHKALNSDLRAAIQSEDDASTLPLHYRVQMEQQLMVSGAERVLFMSSAWDDENLLEERHCWYRSDPALRQQIADGWAQFERDLAAYSLPPPAAEPVTAAPVEALPAVAVRMDGALVVQSNLPAFGAALRAFVAKVPKRPSTDQEFADTDAACKALKRAEEALDAAEANALASLADVETMRRMVADFRTLARDTRLASEKMVERRKQELKESAVVAARNALDLHIAAVNSEIAPMRLQPVLADFAGAIKGKRSIDSMQDALDTTLAAAKIAADAQGRHIRANVERWKAMAEGCEALFPDLHTLVHKAPEDFGPLVAARVVQHRAAEAAKIEAAEKRAREQEAARIAAQQAESARLEALAVANRARLAAEAQAEAAAAVVVVAAPGQYPSPAATATAVVPPQEAASPTALSSLRGIAKKPPRADEPATLTLGMICERLGVTVRADFLADTLHVAPAKVEGKRPGTYTETQFGLICRQLASHVSAMGELYAGETA